MVKDYNPRGRVKKGDVRRAVIVRTAKEISVLMVVQLGLIKIQQLC